MTKKKYIKKIMEDFNDGILNPKELEKDIVCLKKIKKKFS